VLGLGEDVLVLAAGGLDVDVGVASATGVVVALAVAAAATTCTAVEAMALPPDACSLYEPGLTPGTVTETLNEPLRRTRAYGIPAVDPPQARDTYVHLGKPEPVTVSAAPATTLLGDAASEGNWTVAAFTIGVTPKVATAARLLSIARNRRTLAGRSGSFGLDVFVVSGTVYRPPHRLLAVADRITLPTRGQPTCPP
jgi:hypothetical protein